jgi:hypothetical protein
MSVATWSLRLRAVCSLAPAGPASSVTRRSTAVWMSSSEATYSKRPSASSACTWSSAASTASRSSSRSSPAPRQPAHVGTRPGDVVGPHPLVVREADGVRHQRLVRTALEPAVPERRAIVCHAGVLRFLPARAGSRRAGRRRPLSVATHNMVSSPATVPSNPSRPLRSSADATTWAQPGGVRTTTRLDEWVTSATHSPITRRSWSRGATRSGANSGTAYTVAPPGTRTLTAPRSSRSRETVAWVAVMPVRGQQLDELGLVGDLVLLDQAGDRLLTLDFRHLGSASAHRTPGRRGSPERCAGDCALAGRRRSAGRR